MRGGQVLTGGASRKGAQPCLVLSLPGSPALWVGSFNHKINPASSESGVLIISSWQHSARVGWLND